MSAPVLFDSVSGLKPASAFLLIAGVLAAVGVKVGALAALHEEGGAPRVQRESEAAPAFSIHDREGRPLATFVQRLDLVLSANAMWQAHTPDVMARRISEALGGTPDARELLESFLPDARAGVVVARDPQDGGPLRLSWQQASRVEAWATSGSADGRKGAGSIDGLWMEEQPDGTWILCWAPAVTLREDMRARHMPARRHNPLAWTRFLADGLARCLFGPDALQAGPVADVEELEKQRDWIWSALMPSTWKVAVRGFDARRAPALATLLAGERVAHHQMRIERGRTRAYPSGRDELLGFWGHLDEPRARRAALRELGLGAEAERAAGGLEPLVERMDAGLRASYEASVARLLAAPQPVAGLERACDALLSRPEWSALEREPSAFRFAELRPVGYRARPYFLAAQEGSEPPRVLTTVDALLQHFLLRELERLMETHAPALCMAIALEVDSGEVLAVGARSAHELGGWAPVHHQYLPGSTLKVPVMAIALESGRVQPGDLFDVGDGREYHLPGRVIREAELSRRSGLQTAAQCLAYSINAGMVQIGLQLPAEQLRAGLTALRYGEAPRTGLGGERSGHVPELPWKPQWAHASVSFGYETQVTLWQHAAALSAIVRGGEWRPLRLLDRVEQHGRAWPLEAQPGERVLSQQTCAQVRAMMAMGASEGTGVRVAGPALLPGLEVGTKTGTAERVGSEVCIHLELDDQVAHARTGTRCSAACRERLRATAHPHAGRCLTLSMAIFGRRPGADGREVFVLVVVDEPTRKARYGSDTAGPAAVAILREALGETVLGREREEPWLEGFRRGGAPAHEGVEQPWAEVPQ